MPRAVALLFLIVLATFGFATGALTHAQAPPPPPNGVADDCRSINGPVLVAGQQAKLTDPQESLTVDLTEPGEYRAEPNGLPGNARLSICHVQTNASIVISAVTGLEVSRVAADDAGNAVLDALVAHAHAGAGVPSPRPITPPDTGDAGLLR
jgi:hypothetical protein